MIDAIKIILFVNASLAVSFGIFYEIVKACNDVGISPWIGSAVYVAVFFRWLLWECGRTA